MEKKDDTEKITIPRWSPNSVIITLFRDEKSIQNMKKAKTICLFRLPKVPLENRGPKGLKRGPFHVVSDLGFMVSGTAV